MSESYTYSGNPIINNTRLHDPQKGIVIEQPGNLVDLNKIVKTVLEANKQQLQQLSAILRCDHLPFVQADMHTLGELFTSLFKVMIDHPPSANNLFIYLKCKQVKDENLTLGFRDDFTLYNISFHTNIKHGAQWQQLYETKLEECALICERLRGSFENHSKSNSGCIFSLTLPGKLI